MKARTHAHTHTRTHTHRRARTHPPHNTGLTALIFRVWCTHTHTHTTTHIFKVWCMQHTYTHTRTHARTHAHTHAHTVVYQGNGTEERVFEKRTVWGEDLKELTKRQRQGVGSRELEPGKRKSAA